MTQWTPGSDIQVLEAENSNGIWIVSAVGLGSGRCPDCESLSTSRHSRYVRRLQDLPVQGITVALNVKVNRWRCRNRGCERKTFTDLLPRVARPFARRTRRVSELAHLIGHAAGGRPAERLMTRLGLPQSDDTILRQLKRHQAERRAATPVRVAGIDDWSWRKGSSYGTIVVDLERREVVDVLTDRSAASTAKWLKGHPEVEVVSRDRAGLYADGACQGAPKARQVADRFHLLQNLRQTIEQQLSRAPRPTRQPATADASSDLVVAAGCRGHGQQPALAEHRQLAQEGRRATRKSMFDRVKVLQIAGNGIRAIIRATGFNWRTVAKWVLLDKLPERNVMAPKSTTPSKFQTYLSRRWAEGCTTGRDLLPEIKCLGYTGSLSQLERLLTQWRHVGHAMAADAPAAATGILSDPTTGQLVSPIVAAALCIKPRGLLTEPQAAKVNAFKTMSVEFATMRGLAMRFRGILRGKDTEKLDIWLHDADRSGLYGIRRFARSLRQDLAAVRNAITETWSNGQTEGQINRLKTLKRAMYGRAGVELLRARMLPIRPTGQHAD
jgi:transposase